MNDLGNLLAVNEYPGRGIIAGTSGDAGHIYCAYFIMGRSENSRNRVFKSVDGGIFTRAYDESKLTDPSLVIYRAVAEHETKLIITNGDQTDTIADFLKNGKSFEQALETRTYEPDEPNFTPRISALIDKKTGLYKMSILKRGADANAVRLFWQYAPVAGEGRFIHTYEKNGDPLPPFDGEPEHIAVKGDIDAFAREIWENLNTENKISLFVRSISLKTGEEQTRIVNKTR